MYRRTGEISFSFFLLHSTNDRRNPVLTRRVIISALIFTRFVRVHMLFYFVQVFRFVA